MTKATFHLRRPSMTDAEAVCRLVAACDTEDLGAPDVVLDDILDMWSSFDLENNVWVAEKEDQTLIGYAFLEEDSEEKLFSYGCVLPAERGRGVGAALLAAIEIRAVELRDHSGITKRLQGMIPTLCEGAVRLFEQRKFAPVRYFKRLELRLDAEPTVIQPPAGITVQPFRKGRDERAVYDAYVESFADHWDFAAPAFERWVEKTELPTFNEQWWLIAADDNGTVAGLALGRMREDLLYIEQIGVRREFRGRGLALALLQQMFHSSYHAGQTLVALGVDAANPSGAYRLYEKAGMKPAYEISIFEKTISHLEG